MTKDKRLAEYRQKQANLARVRDGGYCVVCYFLLGLKVKASDVHHVYGRGVSVDDPREHYTSLICVCRKHHPQPIRVAPKEDQQWIVDVLKPANEKPINGDFKVC